MCSLAHIISAALLAAPVDARSASTPNSSVAFVYACSPDGHPHTAWGQLAARLNLSAHFDRSDPQRFDAGTLPSYNNILTSLGYNLYSDIQQDDIEESSLFTFFPRAHVALRAASKEESSAPTVLAVRLLEMRVGQQTVGVAVHAQGSEGYLEDRGYSAKLHWHCLHSQPDVRLCALLALRGVARMVSIKPTSGIAPVKDVEATVEQVVTVFERELKHRPVVDRWNSTGEDRKEADALEGRSRFASTVRYFVQNNQPIPFILPAFPCKSSNKAKTSGNLPDKGEDLAAQTLASFAQATQKVYPPGATVHIVSDGHTFADLIGADGAVVDRYSAVLQTLFERHDITGGTFYFHGLEDLLPMLSLSSIEPRSNRQRTPMPDVLRIILSSLWGPSCPTAFAQDGESRMRLFRGLSRFLLEDLDQLPTLHHSSKKQRKRYAVGIAIQMIARNEAYSQLVELSFPGAVRLSIHPHDNRGPKYGVTLLHPRLRSSIALSNKGDLVSDQNAGHTPTPWHNATLMVQENGQSRFALMHRTRILQLQPSPTHELAWVPMYSDSEEEPRLVNEDGGYFYFKQPSA